MRRPTHGSSLLRADRALLDRQRPGQTGVLVVSDRRVVVVDAFLQGEDRGSRTVPIVIVAPYSSSPCSRLTLCLPVDRFLNTSRNCLPAGAVSVFRSYTARPRSVVTVTVGGTDARTREAAEAESGRPFARACPDWSERAVRSRRSTRRLPRGRTPHPEMDAARSGDRALTQTPSGEAALRELGVRLARAPSE